MVFAPPPRNYFGLFTVKNNQMVSALIGLLGALIGSAGTIVSQWLIHHLKERKSVQLDASRKKLLIKMLRSKKYPWRKLETLMHVIGADEENTKRLLLEVGARASEDGRPLWGLIERNPLPEDVE